jgi:predicted TIM-barrel fold metal-dependent hydrolase
MLRGLGRAELEATLSALPSLQFVLAHLGWTAGPDLIGRLLDAYPNLYTDLSIRLDPPGSLPWRNNGLDLSILAADLSFLPAWRALIERHADRFLFAMDINSFGPRYTLAEQLVSTARAALAPLPRPVQEAVAHANIERLLRGCGAPVAGVQLRN